MEFRDKVVLVVGASSGMGRGVALKLAEAGVSIVATARRPDRLESLAAEIGAKGSTCLVLAADAEDEAAAAGVIAAAVQRFGRIDLALLNVGGAPALDLRRMTASEVKAYMRSNYDVTVNYLMPVLRQMVRQRSGLVAHTNSLAGLLGVPLQGPYSAAKGAVRLLIDTCRIEFRSYGIRFVSIYPGFIATERTADDGMPAPLEISEARAIEYILHALRREPCDYLFPPALSWLVRLARILPKRLSGWALGRQMPPLPPLEEDSATAA